MTIAFDSLVAAAKAFQRTPGTRFVGTMSGAHFAAQCPALEMIAGAAGYDLVSAATHNRGAVQLFLVPAGATPVEVQS